MNGLPTVIPKLDAWQNISGKPGWVARVEYGTGKVVKPVIRCNCGKIMGLGNHVVHADGMVTKSFYHAKGDDRSKGEDPDGCNWDVFLKLEGWRDGEFAAG